MKVIAVSELFAIHSKDLRSRPELFGESLRYRIIAGGLVRAEEYLQALALAPICAHDAGRAGKGGRSDVADQRACGAAAAAASRQHLHPAELYLRFQRCGQPCAVRLQRLRRGGLRSLCRSSAGCSMRRRCCGPATPTSALRRGGSDARRCPCRSRPRCDSPPQNAAASLHRG